MPYGAPGRLEEGQVEISGTATGLGIGGPTLAYGLTDWLAVEGGANLSLVNGGFNWAMAYAGPRLSYVPDRGALVHLVSDLELGVGGGVGGVLGSVGNTTCSPCDGRKWSDRPAGGGYQGIGLGGRFDFFTLYARGRIEESKADGVPFTAWGSAMLGFEFDIRHIVAVGLGGGYAGYINSVDQTGLWFYEGGVTIFLDTRRTGSASPAVTR